MRAAAVAAVVTAAVAIAEAATAVAALMTMMLRCKWRNRKSTHVMFVSHALTA
jgi:hypothetical protein